MKKIKLSTFSELSQIISALAVVVSLIYVGAQVNQNTKATQAAMRQSIANNDITYLMTTLDNGILAVAEHKDKNDIELSELEMTQLVSRQYVNFMEIVGQAPSADLNIFGMDENLKFDFVKTMTLKTESSCLFVKDSGHESILA